MSAQTKELVKDAMAAMVILIMFTLIFIVRR